MAETMLVPAYLRADITATLARLRTARTVNPRHEVLPGQRHAGCDVCTAQRRLDWLLDQVQPKQPEGQPT